MKRFFRHTIVFIATLFPTILFSQGSVYLVLGSDTGIWEGLNTGRYNCTYNLGLFDDPLRNASTVMDPAFRQQFRDSYGQPMKMTWWMMAGNVFRFATNKNVPVPNTMTLSLMKKYHGEKAVILGDELSLHYHTFHWSDYNKDGIFYWNQAKTFDECKEDFDQTLAQFLLEENIFPVSFRSGWHFMDNAWQQYIDDLIPYSLHNDYPAKRTSDSEPIDNVFDWSRSSKEFVPFHPSLSDYQVPGNGKSWNTRSYFMGKMNQAEMDAIFLKAMNGIDQVPCLWAHLPEADFPQNMRRIDSLAHVSALKYPSVKFSYSTATEAMQKWRKGTDTIPPVITITEVPSGDLVSFSISTDENIFQSEPFVAVKNINEQYSIVRCTRSGANQWMTNGSLLRSDIAKAGVALTDTMGNLATAFINFLPDDLFMDNGERGYEEISGIWTTNATRSWGTDSRQSVLGGSDTVIVQWKPHITQTRMYSVFVQIPNVQNPANKLTFKIFSDSRQVDSVDVKGPLVHNDWVYITSVQLASKAINTIQMIAYGKDQIGTIVAADAIKVTALIKERQISTVEKVILPAPISEEDSVTYPLRIYNQGIMDLTISELYTINNTVVVGTGVPFVIAGMKSKSLPLLFYSASTGVYRDTIIIKSDDAINPIYKIPVLFSVEPYFRIIDNDDSLNYSETGPWATSVAQVWGSSSRYAPSGRGAHASFMAHVKKNGQYEIFEIVPNTVNAVANAFYVVTIGSDTLGSVVIDQNAGSGNWVPLGKFVLNTSAPVKVTVIDKGPASASVLRADAVKFQILLPASTAVQAEKSITTFTLDQNYPNPFNPLTSIRFALPVESTVKLSVYDMLGREITTLLNEYKTAGVYTIPFDGSHLSSGMYIYRIKAGTFIRSKVMMLLK